MRPAIMPPLPTITAHDLLMHFEDHIVEHDDVFRAAARLHGRPAFAELDQMFNNRELVMRCLAMLGYNLQAPLPWLRIGITWDEGPVPELPQIEARVRLATQLLHMAMNTATNAEVKHEYGTLITDLQDAGAQCIQHLPTLTIHRRKRQKDFLPRVREVEGMFLNYMRDHWGAGQAASIQLQLSNLQELSVLQIAATPPPSQAMA
jgi:hypothetical protein